ncbi:Acetyltransferase [Pseudocercospora fuligena]|uniref:Acetyltransferase n=1 Tax=Pseudocercospora fuligena TaxID=685502 RepID=A0A8H6VIB7_9PEZI|nr:Acetyltransferase [Pseudocercospora fuligena]
MGEPIEFTKTVTEATYFIAPVRSKEDLETTKALFKVYAESLGIDLTFQDFASEMASMPGKYAPPEGALFLAHNSEDEVVGCVGLRPLPSAGKGFCEMKRLYVDPKGRGMGIGKALAETAIDEAKRLGYEHVVLDTLANMTSARKLYRWLGFVPVEAYYENPIDGTMYMQLDL